MSTPLSATGRITCPYVVSGKTHKAHFYCRGIAPVGGSFNINSRTLDANDIVWTDAAERATFVTMVCAGTAVTPGDQILEKLIGGVWVPQAFHTSAQSATGGTIQLATQLTLYFRDITFKKVKCVLMETIQVVPYHSIDPLAGDVNMDALIKAFTVDHLNANDPFVWMVGRSNQYLNTASFVSATTTHNRKMRRARGQV